MPIFLRAAGPIGNQPTAGSDLTLTLPTPSGGILSTDFLTTLVINNTVSTWATTAFNASGHTRRNVNTSGTTQSPSGAIFYRFGDPGGTTITGTSPGGTSQGIVLAWGGVDTTTPFDAADTLPTFGAVTAYDVLTQTTTMDRVAQLILAYANSASGSFTPPTTPASFTEDADNVIASTPHLWVGHLLDQPAGATGTRNLVRSGAVRGGAIGVLLRPAIATALTYYRPAVNRASTY